MKIKVLVEQYIYLIKSQTGATECLNHCKAYAIRRARIRESFADSESSRKIDGS